MGKNLANIYYRIKDYPLGVIDLNESRIDTWDINRNPRYKGQSVYKIETRLIEKYVGKSFDEFYSELVKKLPYYFRKRVVYRWYSRPFWYTRGEIILENNYFVRNSEYKRKPILKVVLPTKDFKARKIKEYIHPWFKFVYKWDITNINFTNYWLYLNKNKGYEYKILSGSLVEYNCKDYRYKRHNKQHNTAITKYNKSLNKNKGKEYDQILVNRKKRNNKMNNKLVVGDIVTSYYKGIYKVVEVRQRWRSQDYKRYSTEFTEATPTRINDLIRIVQIYNSELKPVKSKVVKQCDALYCKKISDIASQQVLDLERKIEFYKQFLNNINES